MLVSSNTCRFCLILVDNENVPLFYNDSPRKVMDIAAVQVSEGDGLPNVICPSCFAQLELSHQFKLQVEKADKILREEISINTVLRDESEIVECKDEIVECKDEIVDCKDETVECRDEVVECRDDIVECKNVENENVEIATKCVFQQVILLVQETNTTVCALEHERTGDCPLEHERTGDEKEMHTGKAEENHKNDEAGETENMTSEENVINIRHVCEIEGTISHKDDLNNEANSFDNNTQEKTNSIKQNQKDKPTKDSETYVCEVCHASFKFGHLLNFHRVMLHMHYKCKKCGKVFSSKTELENHRRIHLNESVTCLECGKVYKSHSGLKYHSRTCNGKNEHSCTCEICGKSFLNINGLKSHKVIHDKNKKRLTHNVKKSNKDINNKATSCTVSTQEKTNNMKQNHIDKSIKDCEAYKCELCQSSFRMKHLLNFHRLVLHTDHKCKKCNKVFSSRKEMENHSRIHLNERLTCTVCGKVYKTSGGVNFHMKACHTKNRCSLICEICGKSYCTISALKIHKESHVEGRKPVICKLCNKTLPHALALKSHKRWVHLVSPPFHCDICNKVFKHPQLLKKHKQRHSLERPHVCCICGSAFPWKSNLRTHMKVHTGVEPYCCQHCGQPFKWRQSYDKHVLNCSDKKSNDDVESTGTSTTTD